MSSQPAQLEKPQPARSIAWARYFPFLRWLFHYDQRHLSGDVIAGVIVAVMLVPQGMAYALLAGLPPEIGLYASIAPVIIYGLLGTSSALAVGPTAMVSLLVATGIGALEPQSVTEYIMLAGILALQIGLIQMAMGLLRVGFLVNFLSHPVLSGFTSAAAIIIGFSQLKHLLGINIPRSDFVHETIFYTAERITQTNLTTLALGVVSIAVLLVFKFRVGRWLRAMNLSEAVVVPLTKTGPLVVVVFGTLAVWLLELNTRAGVNIVGNVPAGLPPLTAPSFDLSIWQELLPVAVTVSMLGFIESISVGKSLASKKRQKIDANQELVALGAANLGATFTGGYPVTGGFSRSIVNFTAGANTGLASIITAILIAITMIFLTPLFFYLPNVVLAAIIIMAVTNLLDWKTFQNTLNYSRIDAASLVATFFAVLFIGIEPGIFIGAGTALGLYLWRTSRPHIAVVGRIGDSEHFRNINRHEVNTQDNILAVRVDESLYFPNAQYLEEVLLGMVADNPRITHLVLICSAVNYIDTSALEVLESLKQELNDAGVQFCMSEVKGPVMDRLEKVGFVETIGRDHVFLSTHLAMETLAEST